MVHHLSWLEIKKVQQTRICTAAVYSENKKTCFIVFFHHSVISFEQ